MDRLSAMRVFVAVVESQGFSAASRSLGMPLPTVCRKVADLESQLGAQLLNRSTRKVTITTSGRHYYEEVRQILEDVDNAERQVSGEYQRTKGLLSVTAPSLFGRLHVLPVVKDFMAHHDEIQMRLNFTNHVLDLAEEQINLAVRIGARSAGSMTATHVGAVRQVVCASPAYLRQYGRPAVPKDITGHQCVTFSRSSGQSPWVFQTPAGKMQHVTTKSRLSLNTVEAAVDWTLQDGGLTQLYSYQAASHVASGALEIVLKDFEIDPPPVCFVYSSDRRLPQKLKAFIDFAMPMLKVRLDDVAEMCRCLAGPPSF